MLGLSFSTSVNSRCPIRCLYFALLRFMRMQLIRGPCTLWPQMGLSLKCLNDLMTDEIRGCRSNHMNSLKRSDPPLGHRTYRTICPYWCCLPSFLLLPVLLVFFFHLFFFFSLKDFMLIFISPHLLLPINQHSLPQLWDNLPAPPTPALPTPQILLLIVLFRIIKRPRKSAD